LAQQGKKCEKNAKLREQKAGFAHPNKQRGSEPPTASTSIQEKRPELM